jgi:hypothetical protein
MFPMRVDAHWNEVGLVILRLILVDESKRKDYIPCAVEIDLALAPAARVALNRLRLKGQRSIHFVNEREARKRHIIEQYLKENFNATCFVVQGKVESLARRNCLEALVESLDPLEHYVLVFDRDETREQSDRLTLSSQLKLLGTTNNVNFFHSEPHEEKLLWLPDAIGWCYARGGGFRRKVTAARTRVVHII